MLIVYEVCDRCGKKMKDGYFHKLYRDIYSTYLQTFLSGEKWGNKRAFILCSDCKHSLEEWLEGSDKV